MSSLGLTPQLFQQMLLKMGVGAGKPPGSPQIPQGMPGTGPVGGPPQMNAPVAGMGGAMPGAGPSAVPPVAPQIPPRQGTGPGMRTGPYVNSGDRAEALTGNAIQSLSSFVNQAKERKEAHTRAQAENYMVQLINAQQALKDNPQDAGARATVDMIMNDSKIQKTLEKGLDFIFPKEPGEPAPPEAHGIMAGIKKAIGMQQKQQGGGGRALAPSGPTPQQIQQLIQQQQLAQQAQTNQLKAGANTTPQEFKQQAAVKAGTAQSADAQLAAKTALEVEKLRAQSQGYRVLSDGPVPAVQGPDGRIHIPGDTNAPADVNKVLGAISQSNQLKYGMELEKESRLAARQLNLMTAREDFTNQQGLRSDLRPLVDKMAFARSAFQVADKAKAGDLQSQQLIASALFRVGDKALPNTKAMMDAAAKNQGIFQKLSSMVQYDPSGNVADIALTTKLPPEDIESMLNGIKVYSSQNWILANTKASGRNINLGKVRGSDYLDPASLGQKSPDRGPQAHKKAEAATPPTLKRGPAANKKQSNVVTMDDMKNAGVGAQ